MRWGKKKDCVAIHGTTPCLFGYADSMFWANRMTAHIQSDDTIHDVWRSDALAVCCVASATEYVLRS